MLEVGVIVALARLAGVAVHQLQKVEDRKRRGQLALVGEVAEVGDLSTNSRHEPGPVTRVDPLAILTLHRKVLRKHGRFDAALEQRVDRLPKRLVDLLPAPRPGPRTRSL